MAWTVPFTAVAGSVFTAAQWNTFIRDNLAETMPGRALTQSAIFAVDASNQVAERLAQAFLDTQQVNVTTTSFGDPDIGTTAEEATTSGPSVTVQTGAFALVGYRAMVRNPSVTARVEMSYEVSGATDISASTTRSVGYSVSNSASALNLRSGVVDLATLLTPGLNTFKLMYNVSSGTGVVDNRRIWVLPL